jgi:site-specific DNA-methyltransferase (adenine-specific)
VIPSVDLAALVLFDSATKLGADKNNLVSCDAKVPRIGTGSLIGQIAASIKEFGFRNPILVDGVGIIAGHGRLLAAQKLNLDKVPTIDCSDMTESQKKAYIIADNKLAMNAGWDTAMLSIEMKDLEDEGFDLTLLGFDDKELNALLEPEVTEGLTDEDAVPDVPEEPKTKLGDIYILGNHRLMCGDSTSIDAVDKLMNGQLADQLVTDPPYNIAYEGGSKKREQIKNDEMADEEFRQFLKDVYIAANAVMKAGAVFYIWHADTEGYNFRGAARDMGWKVRQTLIWNKDNSAFGRSDYHWKHEPCLYGWKDGAAHLWATDRKQTTVIECKRPSKSDLHPTMKPVELMEYQILNNTKGSDIVLDLFGGSGSTMIAAEKIGRKSCLMELDPKYCDVIVKRWEDFTGKQAVLSEL